MELISYIAIAVITAGVSYVQAKKMKKRVEDDTRGVEANIESTSKEIPVIYGERRVGGVRPYITTEYDYNDNLYMVLVLGEGEIDSVSDIRIDDIPITDERFRVGGVDENPNFWYELKNGAVDQTASDLLKQGASYSIRTDLITPSTRDKYKDQHFQTSSDGNTYFYPWHDNHKLSGVAYLALKFKYDQNAYSGIPDVTCLVKGKKVYDPRKDSTVGGTGDHRADDQTTWEWSENPALCIRDYLLNDIYGKGLPVTAIDDASFIKSANDCDTFTVTPYQDAPEDQKLFEMNAVVDTGKKILDNLVDMLVSCRGFIPYQNGKYSLIIDQVGSSVFDVQADHIISGISIAGTKKEDRFNQVKINFFNKDYNYKEDQAIYPESDSELYTTLLAEDEGESLVEELDIFSIDNFYSARDIARLVLERSRKNMTIQFTATSELINVNVTDVISITHPTPEWTAKLFQVQEITLKFDGTVDLTCIEYDADLYTYDEPEEQQPYIGSLLPDPNTVQPIETLTTSKGVYIQNDGQSVGYIDVTWDLPDNQLITRYDVKHVHNGVTDVVNVATNSYRIMPTQDGQNYTISVRAVNALGVTSAWITATAVASSVDTTPPADVTGGSVTSGLNQLTLSWTNPSDDDFDLVKIKVGDDNNVNNAIELASTRSDTFIHDINAYETTKYYWVAPVDRTGNVGNYVSIGSATTGKPSYDDLSDKPTIPIVPEVATTAYLTLSDSNAPTDTEFNTAVGRDPIENDFVVVSYTVETVTNTKAYVYKTVAPAIEPDWTEVTEYIDGSMIVTGSLSASDITTGTLNANDVTISNLTITSGQLPSDVVYTSGITDVVRDGDITDVVRDDDITNVVFDDDLNQYVRLDSVENLLLSFDQYADQETVIDWTGYDAPTDDMKVVKSSDAVTGGSYLEIGNNSGNDEAWLIYNQNIPFDPDQTYRVTVRAKQTAGSGTAYFGFAGVQADGTTLVNGGGSNSYSSQHYFAGSGADIPTEWTEYVGYVNGVSSSGTTSHKPNYDDPAVMHQDTRFVRPLILVNYNDVSGITLIDSFKIESITANPQATVGADWNSNVDNIPTDLVFTSAIEDFITAGDVNASVTSISGGVIQTGTALTVGTGNDVAVVSGADTTYRLWAGNVDPASANFAVSKSGVLYSTGAIVSGNITANSLDVENATVTGTLIAPIGWSDGVYTGVINRGNLNESVKDLIDERIAEVTGGISGDFGQDDGSFAYIAQGNPDPDNPIVLNIAHENGKDLTVELSGSRSWNRQFVGLPDTDMDVTIILERSPSGADTWTTLTTLTQAGSSITTSGPTVIHSSTYAYSVSIYHVLTDDQASGNYDYRARTTVAGSAYNVGIPLQLTVVEPATVGAGNADTLDNEDGTYYLNYNNFTNTPNLSGYATTAGDTFTGLVTLNSTNGWGNNTGSNQLRINSSNGYSALSFYDDDVAEWSLYLGGAGAWAGEGNLGFATHSGTEDSSRVKFKIDTDGNTTALGSTISAGGTFSEAVNITTTTDGKLNLRVKSGDTNDWNYINFYGLDEGRDGYIGTDSTGKMAFQRHGVGGLVIDSSAVFDMPVLQNSVHEGWVRSHGTLNVNHFIDDIIRLNRSSSGYNSYHESDIVYTSFVARTDFKVISGGTHWGITFHADNTNSADEGYQVILRSINNVRVQKRTGGAQTTVIAERVQSADLDNGWHSLEVAVNDDGDVLVYIDDALVIDENLNDTTFTSGVVGLIIYDGNVEFRGFNVVSAVAQERIASDLLADTFLSSTGNDTADGVITFNGNVTNASSNGIKLGTKGILYTYESGASYDLWLLNTNQEGYRGLGVKGTGELIYWNGASGENIITDVGYNKTNWDTAYTYSQVGHLPLAGGTLSGDLNFSAQENRAIKIDTTVADDETRDAIELFEDDGQATGRQAISWWNDNQNYYKARLWTEVGNSYGNTKFGIDVADNARTVATRLYFSNGDAVFTKTLKATDLSIESGPNDAIRIGDGFGTGGSATIHNYNQVLYLQYNNGQADTKVLLGGGGTTCHLDATGNLVSAGYLATGGASLTNLSSGAIRSAGYIDTANVTNGAFRIYDGTTFRGGFGSSSWGAVGDSSADDMLVYSVGDKMLISTDGATERALFQADDIRFDGGKVRVGNPTGLSGRSSIRIDSSETAPADLLFGTDKTATSWNNVHWSISSRGTSEGSCLKIYRGSGHDSPNNTEFVLMQFNKEKTVSINGALTVTDATTDIITAKYDANNYTSLRYDGIDTKAGGNLLLKRAGSTRLTCTSSSVEIVDRMIIDSAVPQFVGYYNSGEAGKWQFVQNNNHADACFSNNLYLNSNHDLVTSNTHGSIRGSAMVATGNNHSVGAGRIAFYAQGDGSATAGNVVAEEDWKVLIKDTVAGGNLHGIVIKGGAYNKSGAIDLISSDSTRRALAYMDDASLYFGTVTNHDVRLTVNNVERVRVNNAGLRVSGTLTVTSNNAIDFTNNAEVILNHTANTTPVPFNMQKGGTVESNGASYGVLHLSRINHTNTAVGVGANLFFQLKDSGGTLREFAGIGGIKDADGAGRLDFYNYGRNVNMRLQNGGSLQVAGNITAYSDPSDRRLKENIVNIPDALDKVCKLNGVTFTYKKDGGKSTGLIAQELLDVLPEVVYTTNDMENPEDEFYAVNYGNTVGLLVEAIKELKQEIEVLKNGTN